MCLFDSVCVCWGTGAGIDVVKNGTTILSTTLASGDSASFSIQTNIGDTLDFVYTAPSSYSGENSYKVHDQNGIEVIHQGTGNATPNSVLGYISCASCPAPVQVNVSNITSSSADFVWYGFGASGYNVQYDTAGFTPGTGTIVAVTETNYSLTGLAVATSYDFWVQSDCGTDSSSYAGPFTFMTTLPAPQGVTCSTGSPNFIFSDNMDATGAWSGAIGGSNGQWDFPTRSSNSPSTGPSGPASATSGSSWAESEARGNTSTIASLVSPMIVLSGALSSAELLFYMHAYGIAIGTLNVGVGTSAAGPFTNVFSNTGQIQMDDIDPWTHVGIDVTSYLGQQIYIEFSYGGTGSSYTGDLAIDMVQLQSCATCPAATALDASGVTANSANLSWTSSSLSTASDVEYGLSGFSLGSGTSVNVTVDTLALTGLSADTRYDFYVRSDCGSDSSGYAGPLTFRTSCGTSIAPYFEHFDGGLSTCWTNDSTDVLDWSANSGGTPSSSTGPSDDVTGGGSYIYVETSGSAAGDSAMITTGDIDISGLTSPALRMYTHMLGGSMGELSVWITDASGTMTQVFVKNGDQGDVWAAEYIDLSSYGGTVNFTLLYINSATSGGTAWQGDCSIDNFEVMELPACIDPYGLAASNVLSTTADLSWTNPSSTVTSWNYVYDTAGFDPLTATPVSTANTTVSLTGLSFSTSYDVYLQSDCGSNVGTWLGPLNFTTLPDAGTCGLFTVDLFDSFGDGWNGDGLIVNVNSVLYDTLSVASGDSAPY